MKILTGAISKILIAMFLLSSTFDTQYELQSRGVTKRRQKERTKSENSEQKKIQKRQKKKPQKKVRPKEGLWAT